MGVGESIDRTLSLQALGKDVKLGMLYDARTSSFFGGASPWADCDVNDSSDLPPGQVQNATFVLSTSLDNARENAQLDVEGSLCLDLGLLKAEGSAAYLNVKKKSAFEAHLSVSCTVERRTRRIPQETLASVPFESHLQNERFTHYVAEVVEGGTATLSFAQTCASEEEMTRIQGALEVSIQSLMVVGTAKVEYNTENTSTTDNLRVSYSGAIVESVSTFEDACRVAREMPDKLAQQMNTLSYTLVPLSVIDSNVRRQVRQLDITLVKDTAATIKHADDVRLDLESLHRRKQPFPAIQKQVLGVVNAFERARDQFIEDARRLLPELRDGTTDYNTKVSELQKAQTVFKERIRLGEVFADKKRQEASILAVTIDELVADGFENHVVTNLARSLIGNSTRLLLSFGGNGISLAKHPLQSQIDPADHVDGKDDEKDSDDDDGEDVEWFEDDDNIERLTSSCTKLRDLRSRLTGWGSSAPEVSFGVASTAKATLPGSGRRKDTKVGDIVLSQGGTLVIVTSLVPETLMLDREQFVPNVFDIACESVSVSIPKNLRGDKVELVMPTTDIVVRYCAVPNPGKDGAFPRAAENEAAIEVSMNINRVEDMVVLSELKDDCDYLIDMCYLTTVGPSKWSAACRVRTKKPPSVASELLAFYAQNKESLSTASKPWEMSADSNVLYLGHKIMSERQCEDSRFGNQPALRIVDVAPQFRPEVQAADVNDSDNTVVLVFVGASGHGKSTEINALIAFLLGSDMSEPRLMVIDDRGADQTLSVTKYITCYRLRPLAPSFCNKTLVIVDTPGYGDSGTTSVHGYERDQFITAAMNVFFSTVNHVNAIVFTCRANETRTTNLSPVSTYVFQLFAKNVESCLRTIYTFSDAGNPQARDTLRRLQWPVGREGEVEVNNAAFSVTYTKASADKLSEWWRLSMKGQYLASRALLSMPPTITKDSKEVVSDRLQLERKLDLTESKLVQTANDAFKLTANLGALANIVGASPGEKVSVKVIEVEKKDRPEGTATTLCTECNHTCHQVCYFRNDEDKAKCSAMNNGKCTQCKGRCAWDLHTNATFVLTTNEVTKWVIPSDLIKKWNSANNSLEGALIGAMDEYLNLQLELQTDILYLAELTEKLEKKALLHNPAALLNYVETLIKTARARGTSAEHIALLTAAKSSLQLAAELKQHGPTRKISQSQSLMDILQELRNELKRRMDLPAEHRAAEETKPCQLYNKLRTRLPAHLQKSLPILKQIPVKGTGGWLRQPDMSDPLYPDNLREIVKLVQLVLRDGAGAAAFVQMSTS